MNDKRFIESRVIELPHGYELEISMTQEFIDKLIIHYNLQSREELTDHMIRSFVWGSLNDAVNKL